VTISWVGWALWAFDEGRKGPDGVVVDVAAGHIYWTNMGNFKENDGAIRSER